MTTVAPGTTFFFRVRVLVGHVWEQEESGLNFKRPLLPPWTEQEENFGDTHGGANFSILVSQSVVCGPALTASLGSLLEMRISGPVPDPMSQCVHFNEAPGDWRAQSSLRNSNYL